MSIQAVAHRYATALVQLTAQHGTMDAVAADLDRLATLLDAHSDLRAALSNPSFRVAERMAVIRAVVGRLGAHVHTQNFLFLLTDRNRFKAFDAIRQAFQGQYDDRRGRGRAIVSSAVALDDGTVEALRRHLLRLTGKTEIVIERRVDPALLGGIVTRIGDKVLDGSVRTQLRLLRDHLATSAIVGDA